MDHKARVFFAIQISLALVWIGIAGAQIRSDEASRDFLASQCASSARSSAENYRDYGAKLALTLSALDANQQERVFGFVPKPGASASTNTPLDAGSNVPNDVNEGTEDSGVFENLLDGAIDLLGGILFPEPDPGTEPIIAGTPPGTDSASGDSIPDPPEGVDGESDGNNGHGNDPGGIDPSNPGSSGNEPPGYAKKDTGDDGNNGHGNDPGGVDPSNPGNGSRKNKK